MDNNIRYGNIVEYFAVKSRKVKMPFSGTLELTPRCNMNCKMCYIRMTESEMNKVGKELSVEEWIRIAKEAVDSGMVMILLTGGEALLYRDFKKLYLALRKMGIFISINTNGTTLTDSWIEFFKQYPPAKFNITIYGGSNETYNRLCSNPKGFDQLKSTIKKLQENNIDILLNCMITKQNVDDMELIYQFGRENNLEVHATTYSFPPVRKEGIEDPELNRFTAHEAARARVKLNWYSLNNREHFIQQAKKLILDVENAENIEETCGVVEGDKVQCAAGRSNFWITWDGRMLPCGMIPDFSVPVREQSFANSWKEITEYTDHITLAPECKNCKKKKICMPCAAKITAETGEYNRKAQYLCEYVDEYIRLLGEAIKHLENE